jgi:hypothetical protein
MYNNKVNDTLSCALDDTCFILKCKKEELKGSNLEPQAFWGSLRWHDKIKHESTMKVDYYYYQVV